jgi:hypothetical protein
MELYIAGVEALTAVVNKFAIFRDIALYSLYINRRFGGTYHHLQGGKSDNQESSALTCDMFVRNVGLYTHYTVLCPRRWQLLTYCNYAH